MPAPVPPQSFGGDTVPGAREVQERAIRALSGPQRLALALEMSEMARSLLASRLRLEHPDWSPARHRAELLRLTTGYVAQLPR